MLKVFGDESADETQSRAFAMAALVGRESDWQAAEDDWLQRTGGKIFHAADCEHQGDLDLYKDLTQIIARSRLGGRAVALDLTEVKEYLPGVPRYGAYHICFLMMVPWFVDTVAAALQDPIEFTFDRRQESERTASKSYETDALKKRIGIIAL